MTTSRTNVTNVTLSNATLKNGYYVTNVVGQTIKGTLTGTLNPGDRLYGSLDDGAHWIDITHSVKGLELTWMTNLERFYNGLEFKVVDASGKSYRQWVFDYKLDTRAPSHQVSDVTLSSDTGASNADFITKAPEQTITAKLTNELGEGKAAGDRLFASVNNGKNWVDISDKVNGTTLTWTTTLASGPNVILFKLKDQAGNESFTGSTSYTLDKSARVVPTGTHTVSISDDTGPSSTDRITSDSLVKVTLKLGSALTLAADEVLQISADGGLTWVKLTGSGTVWSTADNAVALQSGSGQAFTARIIDIAGNISVLPLNDNQYSLQNDPEPEPDTSVTPAPAGTHTVSLSDDTGTSNTDRITSDSQVKVTLNLGSALALAADEALQVSADGGLTWVQLVSAKTDGTVWSSADNAVTLQSGSGQAFTARIIDTAGNISALPLSDNQYSLQSDPEPEPDTSVTPAPTGTHTVSISDDTGTSNTDRITSDSLVKVTLKLGSALALAADETLQVSADGGLTWVRLTGSGSGTVWSTADNAVTLLSGSGQAFTARITDTAGNISALPLTDNQYSLQNDPDPEPEPDTSVTPAPAGTHTVSLSDDTGTSNTDRITSDSQVKVTLKLGSALTLAADETLQVSADGGLTWVKLTGSGTVWSTADNAVTLQSGSGKSFTARIIDTAGNISALPLTDNQYSLQNDPDPEPDPEPDTTVTPAPTGTHTVSISDDTGTSNTDRITSDSQVKVTLNLGSALALAADEALQISADGGLSWVRLVSDKPDGTVWSSADNAVTLQSGSGKSFTARIIDTAGNISALPLSDNQYSLQNDPDPDPDPEPDTSVTPAPIGTHTVSLSDDTGTSNTDRITSDSQVKVTLNLGSALALAADETLQVSADGGLTWVKLTGSGTVWSTADNAVTLLSGSGQAFTARITDTAGNISVLPLTDNQYSLQSDPVPDTFVTPAPTGTHTVSISDDTGPSSTDRITNDSQVKVTLNLGSALALAADEVLQVSADGGLTWVKLTGSGTVWSTADNAVTLLSGSGKAFTARIIDTAGNISALPLSDNQYSLQNDPDPDPDTFVTPAPTGTHTVSISDDKGTSNTDRITSDSLVKVTLKLGSALTLAADETLQVSADGGLSWVRLVSAKTDGTVWSSADNAVTLQSGSGKSFTARIIDTAGNVSAIPLTDNSYTLDTTPPDLSVSQVRLSDDTGTSADDLITSNAAQTIQARLSSELAFGERLYGRLKSDAQWQDITNSLNGTSLAWATVLQEGTHAIEFKVQDAAGNETTSQGLSYTLDRTVPTISDLRLSADTGPYQNDRITQGVEQTITATIKGLEQGGRLYGRVASNAEWQDLTPYVQNQQLTWTDVRLRNGPQTLEFKLQDKAGNEAVSPFNYTLDTTAPQVQTVNHIRLSHDSGSSDSDLVTQIRNQTVTATLSGPLQTNDLLYASLDGGLNWIDVTTSVKDNRLEWVGAKLQEGTNTLLFKIEDRAGNSASVMAGATEYTCNTNTPSTSVTGVAFSSDTGTSNKDRITQRSDNQKLTISLNKALGNYELLYGSVDGGKSWVDITSLAKSATQFTWSQVTLNEGSNVLAFKVVDAAGNANNTANFSYTQYSAAPTLTDIRLSDDTGSSSTDFITQTPEQTIRATLSASLGVGSKLEGALNGWGYTDITHKVNGTSITWDGAKLSNGINTLYFRITDAAGNAQVYDDTVYNLDRSAPTFAIDSRSFRFSNDDGISTSDLITTRADQTISATLRVQLDTGDQLHGSVDNGVTWKDITRYVDANTLTWNNVTLTPGAHTIQFRAIDKAGNLGAITSFDYTLNARIPVVTGISFGNDTGINTNDLLTSVETQTITGTLSNPLNGKLWGSVDSGKTWVDVTGYVNDKQLSWSGITLQTSVKKAWEADTIQFKYLNYNATTPLSGIAEFALQKTAALPSVTGVTFSEDSYLNLDRITKNELQSIVNIRLSGLLKTNEHIYGSLDDGTSWTELTHLVNGDKISWREVRLLEGTHQMKFKAADAAGNVKDAGSYNYSLCSVMPSISNLSFGTDTGFSGTDLITNTPQTTIRATLSSPLQPGARLYADLGNEVIDITDKVQGTSLLWSNAPLTNKNGEEAHSVKLTLKDNAGNDTTIYQQRYTLDTSAPTQKVSNVALSADTGDSSTDRITNTPVQTVTGKLDRSLDWGSQLQGSVDNGQNWVDITRYVNGLDLKWVNATLVNGANTLLFKVVDKAGNTSATTGSSSYILDTSAPSSSVGEISLSADTGTSNSDFITNVAGQTIRATLSAPLGPGEKLFASLNNGANWTDISTKVRGTSITWDGVTLQGGHQTMLFKVTNLVGNETRSGATRYVLDTLAPNPIIRDVSFSADSGPSSSDRVTEIAQQTINATLSAALDSNDLLYASLDKGITWEDITDRVRGTTIRWDNAMLFGGPNTILFKSTDKAGNLTPSGGITSPTDYTLNSSLPWASGVTLSEDSGLRGDRITNQALQTISATLNKDLSATETLYARTSSQAAWTDITSSVTGTDVRWNTNLRSGSQAIQFQVRDNQGNAVISGSTAYTLDTDAPTHAVSGIKLSDDTAPNGTSNNDFITRTANQAIQAKLSAPLGKGEKLLANLDGTNNWTDISNSVRGNDLNWITQLREGNNVMWFKVQDEAGNESRLSSTTYTLDTQAPSTVFFGVEWVPKSADGKISDSGVSAGDYITNVRDQTITVSLNTRLEAGARLFGRNNTQAGWTDITSAVIRDGYQVEWKTTLIEGENTTEFKVADLAGNEKVSGRQRYTLDTISPDKISVKQTSLRQDPQKSDNYLAVIDLDRYLQRDEILMGSTDGGKNWSEIIANVSQKQVEWSISNQIPSQNLLVKVMDVAGNESNSTTLLIAESVQKQNTFFQLNFNEVTTKAPLDNGTELQVIKNREQAIIGRSVMPLMAGDELQIQWNSSGNWVNISDIAVCRFNGSDWTYQWKASSIIPGYNHAEFRIVKTLGENTTSSTKTSKLNYLLDDVAPPAPTVNANDNGSIAVFLPENSDAVSYEIKFKDEFEKNITIEKVKLSGDKWEIRYLTDSSGINQSTEYNIDFSNNDNTLRIGQNAVKDGTAVTVTARDWAGNRTDVAVTAKYDTASRAGDPVIDLGTTLTNDFGTHQVGQLIHPIKVEGKWYYHWDFNANGIADDGDRKTYTDLKYIIRTGDLADESRGIFEIKSVKINIPIINDKDKLKTGYLQGTIHSSEIDNNYDIGTLNEISAIWDSFNGQSTYKTAQNGTPLGWANDQYLSASRNISNVNSVLDNFVIDLNTGYVTQVDWSPNPPKVDKAYYVCVQVL